MTTGNAPRRWSDGGGRTTEELKAAELFRSARSVAPLAPESLARIEYGITASMASAVGTALWTKLGVGVVVAALGTAALVAGTRRRAPEPAPVPLTAPAPAQVAQVTQAPAPDPEPRAVVTPGPTAVHPAKRPPHAQDALAEEAALLERAFRALRRNPGAALAALEQHRRRFPNGQLVAEAQRARLDALIALRRHGEAAVLAVELRNDAPAARVTELTLVEGEQLVAMGRHNEALSRFERVIAEGASGSVGERAWFGRTNCRRALGDAFGAKLDAQQYLERFPTGAHANELRRWAE